ncbi:MAG: hypothetical protein WCP89_02140 [archaeon]
MRNNKKAFTILIFLVIGFLMLSLVSAKTDNSCKTNCNKEKQTCIKEARTQFKLCDYKGCLKKYNSEIKKCNANYSPCVNDCNSKKCTQDEYFVKNKCAKMCIFDQDCGSNMKCTSSIDICLTPGSCSLFACPSVCYGYCSK